MSKRTRHHVMLIVGLVAGFAYGLISHDWSDVVFYAGLAGVGLLVTGIGLPWQEFAPDGAFRRGPSDPS